MRAARRHPHSSVRRGARRSVVLLATAGLAAGTLAACAESERSDSSASGDSSSGKTFVFAASSDPVMLDPAMASDGETFRVARQIFEGLVGTKPGTAEPAPLLAESWTSTPDGKSYTFKLKTGVKFHDGTDFNAEAVCANFDRWYNWSGLTQSENLSYYYNNLFKGFKTSDDPAKRNGIYESCAADDASTATIKLKSPFAALVEAMSLPAFSMQSPTAMEKYKADAVAGNEDDPRFGEYATAHPTGTGPFKFVSWNRNQDITLEANNDYWGDKPKISKAIIRTISDGAARKQALTAGDIDGYDLVAPTDVQALKDAGLQVLQRPAFNILYLGMNQAAKPLDNIKVRQAISHAINKDALVNRLPEGTKAATQFFPDTVNGYTEDVTKYDYDPAKAKALLAEAGASNMTLKFNYPTGVSRPYMPNPEDIFAAIRTDLQAVGIKVTPVAAKWSPDYLDQIQGGTDHGIHLLGWTGDYNSSDNFVGVFFGRKSNEWGFTNQPLFDALTKARALPTKEAQVPAYETIQKQISDFVPGVPLAHPVPSLGFKANIKGYQPSPVQDEVWNMITVE